jgi:hypothetical protein
MSLKNTSEIFNVALEIFHFLLTPCNTGAEGIEMKEKLLYTKFTLFPTFCARVLATPKKAIRGSASARMSTSANQTQHK